MRNHWLGKGILCVIAVIAGVSLLGYVVMHLWNWLIPAIFTGAVAINYCQALGILVLSKILFGGFRGRGGCGGCGSHRGGYWRSRWKGKWQSMSEEEREKLRKSCGDWCEPQSKE
jgi:hypothetical protein